MILSCESSWHSELAKSNRACEAWEQKQNFLTKMNRILFCINFNNGGGFVFNFTICVILILSRAYFSIFCFFVHYNKKKLFFSLFLQLPHTALVKQKNETPFRFSDFPSQRQTRHWYSRLANVCNLYSELQSKQLRRNKIMQTMSARHAAQYRMKTKLCLPIWWQWMW